MFFEQKLIIHPIVYTQNIFGAGQQKKMERQPKHTLQTLPAHTLLHHIKKDQLEKALPPHAVQLLRRQAMENGEKFTAKYLKDAVLKEPQYIESLRDSQLGREAFQKYAESYMRITSPAVRAKSRDVRAQMIEPRQGFLGCVATKVDPSVFRECAQTYDNPAYQSISLVPSAALKQSVYKKTGNPVLAAPAGTHISELPRGLKAYIRDNPLQYMDYLDELRAQAEYLKSVGRGVRAEQRQEQEEVRQEGPGRKRRGVVGQGQF